VKQLLHTHHNDKVVAASRDPASATALKELEAAHTERLLLVALDQNDDSSVKAEPYLLCISVTDTQRPYMPHKPGYELTIELQAAMDKIEHERFGKIDYLVNNAGILGESDLLWPIEQDGRPAECASTNLNAEAWPVGYTINYFLSCRGMDTITQVLTTNVLGRMSSCTACSCVRITINFPLEDTIMIAWLLSMGLFKWKIPCSQRPF
jgi:NAD(P)-dependent dehydrogenase (short-subunit alcohol dehydrogenase family)